MTSCSVSVPYLCGPRIHVLVSSCNPFATRGNTPLTFRARVCREDSGSAHSGAGWRWACLWVRCGAAVAICVSSSLSPSSSLQWRWVGKTTGSKCLAAHPFSLLHLYLLSPHSLPAPIRFGCLHSDPRGICTHTARRSTAVSAALHPRKKKKTPYRPPRHTYTLDYTLLHCTLPCCAEPGTKEMSRRVLGTLLCYCCCCCWVERFTQRHEMMRAIDLYRVSRCERTRLLSFVHRPPSNASSLAPLGIRRCQRPSRRWTVHEG